MLFERIMGPNRHIMENDGDLQPIAPSMSPTLWVPGENLSFGLRLHGIGYVQDPYVIGSIQVRIHSVYTGPVLNWSGTVPHRITFISGPIWHQIEDPVHTGSTRSRVNTGLIPTNFVSVPNGSGPVLTSPWSPPLSSISQCKIGGNYPTEMTENYND